MIASLVSALVLTLARYPGDGPVASASRRYVVENETREQASRAGNHHQLFVVERGSGTRSALLEYPRQVTVAWAPDREALAVTNEVGSTQTTMALFVLEGRAFRKLDVGEALYTAFPGLRGELMSYLHVHIELVGWRHDGVEVRLRASAGSGPNVNRKYVVGVDGKAKKV
jgi:hypothetical protein